MAKRLELGIMPHGGSVWETLEVSEMADKAGLDHLAFGDDIARPTQHLMGAGMDTLTLLAAVSLRTKRVRMQTHVFQTPMRHPIELAKRITTIDHLSNGRFIFGVGVAGPAAADGAETYLHLKQFDDLGLSSKERGGRTNEVLEALKILWTQRPASYHGKYFNFNEVSSVGEPVSKPYPPIWVGGNSEAAIKRTVKYATGWLPSFELSSVVHGSFPAAVGRLRDAMKEAGRDGDPMNVCVCVKTNINPDGKAAMDEAKKKWESQGRAIEGGMPFESNAKYGVYGTPEQLVDRLLQMKEYGADTVILHLHAFDLRPQLKRLEQHVLPKI
jgi:alkanesulfonate monooxygenase SsuD/methylene tetrahydromethanopterin reductase-like flavin-dependent oxidoreductase (luciferase family)